MSRQLHVNGRDHAVTFAPGVPLATVLRDHLGLLSVRDDFSIGLTGASTVMIDQFPVIAALLPADTALDKSIVTAEGLADHPLATAFSRHGLTGLAAAPALLVAGAALLAANPRPTPDDIRRGLSGVRCPGTGYRAVAAAVEDAARHIENAVEVRP